MKDLSTGNPQSYPQEVHWSQKANCAGQTNKMFPKGYKDLSYVSEARRLCRNCEVRKECLDYALKFPVSDLSGVWGGLTPRQLGQEQKRRGIVPVRVSLSQVFNT